MSKWEKYKIHELGSVITGSTPKTTIEEYWNGNIPFVSPTDMKGYKNIVNTERTVTIDGAQTGRLIPKGSLMVTCIASIGKMAISDRECITNQQINTIIPNNKCTVDYLYYALLKNIDRLKLFSGTTAIPIINKSTFEQFELEIPPLKEQQKIAEILSSVDAVIEKTEQVIAKTEEVKKGLMQQLLTKGIGHTEFKQTEIGEIPVDWEVCMIKDVVREVSRPIKMIDTEYYSTITCKRRNGGIVLRAKQRGEDIKVKNQYLIKDNDFVISKRQIVHGACGVVPVELDGSIVSNEYTVLNFKDNMNNYYFNYICQMTEMYKNFYLASVGVHIEKMLFRTNDWYKMKLSVPPLEEQLKIVNILDSLNDKIECENKKVDNLQLIRQGLMQQLLTDQTRIKVD